MSRSPGLALEATMLWVLVLLSAIFGIAFSAEPAFNGVEGRPGRPAIGDGVLYVGSESGTVYAVDLRNNTELWSFEADGAVFHAPLVTEELVLFGSQDGRLRALDKSSGALRWSFQAGHVDWPVRDIFINGTPARLGNVVYFSSEDFNVYAVDLDTGTEIWRHTLDEEPQAWELPIADGRLFIGDWSGHLYAIDVTSGERVWQSVTDDTHRASRPEQVPFVTVVPVLTETAVYFTDWAGNLFAVDRLTGEQLWRFDPDPIDSRHVGSRSYMALVDDVLYYSTVEDRHLYGVDRYTGEALWRTETFGIAYGPVHLMGTICLYFDVIPGDNGLPVVFTRALDVQHREVRWSADDMAAAPAVHDDTLIYIGHDGLIYRRRILTGEVLEAPI